MDSVCVFLANISVNQGQANGTQAEVQKVILHPGVQPQTVLLGGSVPVAAVFASQVERIVLKHSNERIHPNLFSVTPRTYTFVPPTEFQT